MKTNKIFLATLLMMVAFTVQAQEYVVKVYKNGAVLKEYPASEVANVQMSAQTQQNGQTVEAVSTSKQAELPLKNNPKLVIGTSQLTFTDNNNSTTFPANDKVVLRIKNTEPQPTAEGYWPVATDGKTIQYIFNIDAKGFLLGANEWETRASISIEQGYKFKVKANGDGTYTLNNYCHTNGLQDWDWRGMYANDIYGIWVDNIYGTNANKWVITPVNGETNVYEISNPSAGPGKLGTYNDPSDTRLILTNDRNYCTRWAFMDEDGYTTYLRTHKDEIEREKQKYLDAANTIALNAQKELIDGTNIYDKTGYNAYVTKYNSSKQKLDAGTLKEATTNPNTPTGWHASTEYNFLLTPWKIGGQQANNFTKDLYVNTWSSVDSNFPLPYLEYWQDSDDRALDANNITTVVSGLKKGDVYDVTVLARLRVKNGASNPTGVTMTVGNGKSVSLCTGNSMYDPMYYLDQFTAQGAVDSNGNLTIRIDVASNNNISGLAFKNVKYTFVNTGTGISTINDATKSNNIYDITGRRIQHPAKGLYIKDGKKILVKDAALQIQ